MPKPKATAPVAKKSAAKTASKRPAKAATKAAQAAQAAPQQPLGQIFHAELWGPRKSKYATCATATMSSIQWQPMAPQTPFYFMVPKTDIGGGTWRSWTPVNDIFDQEVSGIVTARDGLVIDIDEAKLRERLADFRNLSIPDLTMAQKLGVVDKDGYIKNSRGWDFAKARKLLAAMSDYESHYRQLAYRPFDTRSIFYHPSMVDWGREKYMRHMIEGPNVALLIGRQAEVTGSDGYDIYHVAENIVEFNYYRRGGEQVFPLYLYPEPQTDLFAAADPQPQSVPNFTAGILEQVRERYGPTTTPEQLMGYLYAVLHSPTYRSKYGEFLKSDFPRIPLDIPAAIFHRLAELGWQLVQAHLLRLPLGNNPAYKPLGTPTGSDDTRVDDKIRYSEPERRLYLNAGRWFENVPPDVWNFHVGGYMVLEKYLKARRFKEIGRPLTLAETKHLWHVIRVLAFTRDVMAKIDEAWDCP